MWQIMWAFNLIPDSAMAWIINILLIVGIAGTIAGFFLKIIPFVNQYRLPVQIVSIALLVLGVWLKGGQSERLVWQARVAEMEAKVAASEAEAKKVTVKVETKIVERVRVIQGQTQTIVKEVPTIITREVDAKCEIPAGGVELFNRAAKGIEEPKK